MRIFVGFGYLPEEAWVKELVLPMLMQLGVHVVEGEEIPGVPIDAELRRRIESADGLIGLLLRRGKRGRDGFWPTSAYVRQEVEIALGLGRTVIQVVEHGVERPGGFLHQLQFLPYRKAERDRFLLALTTHVRAWIQGEVRVRLAPEALALDLEPDAQKRPPCRYRIVHEGRTDREGTAEIFAEGGGMFAKLLGFRPGTQAIIEVTTRTGEWSSKLLPYAQPFADVTLDQRP